MTKYKLKYHERFDIDDAKTHTWYTLHEWRKNFFGKGMSWKPVKVYTYASLAGGGKDPATGDYFWAKRIAKEFKIKVPMRLEDNE